MAAWKTVQLPEPVVKRIEAHLERDGTYKSRGEVVKRAVLDYLDRAEARGAA